MSQGKHLPSILVPHHKNTAGRETEVMPIPDVVRISMSQSIGAPCKPLVQKGDYVKVGQKIGDSDAFISAPVHSSVSGTVKDIVPFRGSMGGTETHIVIETDKEQAVSEEVKPPEINSFDDFIKAVRASGMVGLGGASFPTYVKLSPKNLDECDTLIVNGAECEPFITADNRMMVEQGEDVLDGMKIIMEHLDLKKGYIGIEENKPDAIANLNRLIDQRGLTNVKTFKLQSRYPKGAERVLVYEVTGKVMDAGVLPAQLGIILDNVTTVAELGRYFRTGMPLVRKRVTVDGDAVNDPKNVFAPIGTQIADIVEFCGGYKAEPKKIVMGGPMMGRATNSDESPIMKNTGSLLIFGREAAQVKEETACINCQRCHSACPFGLMPQIFAEAYERRDVDRLNKFRVMQCMGCGSCSFICPARRPLAMTNTLAKGLVKEAMKK
ncbi:MAG: electron transport complex subunit RsxC [Mobilibacterium timonense]|uniref:electron transport complex subunit RsxC n=1 Tax=Mobilibacterium timonense TaxID=1871012 RepID=UPI00235394D8|nr:electron transport complex subunit RsxC [Mobilibacterium timonense]MBM6990088.1 electron transport complex subunit RsxC [Mobilibacterium timonense]